MAFQCLRQRARSRIKNDYSNETKIVHEEGEEEEDDDDEKEEE